LQPHRTQWSPNSCWTSCNGNVLTHFHLLLE
jgi:hypothetical protein